MPDDSEVGIVAWAEQHLGHKTNNVGQPIYAPVDDPATRHLYGRDLPADPNVAALMDAHDAVYEGECEGCDEPLYGSECVDSTGFHCAACGETCPACLSMPERDDR